MLAPKKIYAALVTGICIFGLFIYAQSLADWLFGPFTRHESLIPSTTHIVLFQYKETASVSDIEKLTSKFFGLKKRCVRPNTHVPYIISITGGKDSSVENLQNGMSYAFIVKFVSDQDRDYYVKHDPAHQSFKDAAAVIVEKAQVIDFREDVFTEVM